MTEPQSDQSAVCRACGYPVASCTASVCPECGRGFDPSDPRTLDRSAGARRRRRLARVAAVVFLIGVAIVGVAPRGYVVTTITLTDVATGIDSSVQHVRLVGPRWLPLIYPGLTDVTDRGSTRLCAAPDAGDSSLAYRLASRKMVIERGWFRQCGSLGASGSAPPGLVNTVNDLDVTPDTAVSVARAITREMARGDAIGVSLAERVLPGGADLVQPKK